MPAAPIHPRDESAPRANRSGWDILGEALFDLCKVGGAATYGAILGGDLGTAIGGVVGGLLVLSVHLTKPSRRS
jgi:hypothetical protein